MLSWMTGLVVTLDITTRRDIINLRKEGTKSDEKRRRGCKFQVDLPLQLTC